MAAKMGKHPKSNLPSYTGSQLQAQPPRDVKQTAPGYGAQHTTRRPRPASSKQKPQHGGPSVATAAPSEELKATLPASTLAKGKEEGDRSNKSSSNSRGRSSGPQMTKADEQARASPAPAPQRAPAGQEDTVASSKEEELVRFSLSPVSPPSPAIPASPSSSPLAAQPHPIASPAKRGAEECGSSGGGMAEKRSRARGPSKEEDQVQAATELLPGKSGPGTPNAAVEAGQQPGSPTPAVAAASGSAQAAEECTQAGQHRRVPRLDLGHLPPCATQGSMGRPPGVHRSAVPVVPFRCTPSPVKLDHKEGESEDEELASWLLEPQWVPDSEGKGHVFKPVSRKELRQYEALISELQPHQAEQVTQLWEALHEARQSCEHMTTRGVRAAKDVTQGWAGIVSDLTDRAALYEAQVRELMLLTQRQADVIEELQLKLASRPGAAMPGGVSTSPACSSLPAASLAKGCSGSGSKGGVSSSSSSAPCGGSAAQQGPASSSREECPAGGGGKGEGGHAARAWAVQREIEALALENAKLASVNTELVRNLDGMTLVASQAQAEVAKLKRQLLHSQEHSSTLEKQLEAAGKARQNPPGSGASRHRYSDLPARLAPRPVTTQAARARGGGSGGGREEQVLPARCHLFGGMHHSSFRSSFGPDQLHPHVNALGNEYKRAAFRAMLSRGGVV